MIHVNSLNAEGDRWMRANDITLQLHWNCDIFSIHCKKKYNTILEYKEGSSVK